MNMNKPVTAISNQSILVVDDDARMLRALEKVLRDDGMDVIQAFGAGEALEILTQRQKKVDLVVTDLRMPFVNGLTLLYAIHEVFPALPVVVLTAFGSPDVRAECLRQGAAAILEKPLDAEHLLISVRHVLSKDTAADKGRANKTGASGDIFNKERSK
jgi:DNA-binding NtrC family response regulator